MVMVWFVNETNGRFSISKAYYIESNADVFDILLNNEKTDFFTSKCMTLANCMKNYYNSVNDDQNS